MSRIGPIRPGDRVLGLDGTSEVIEEIDFQRHEVILASGAVSIEDLDQMIEPDLDNPLEVEQFLSNEWRVGERARFDSVTTRCSDWKCRCSYCYRVQTRVDGELVHAMHYVDAPACPCYEDECPCTDVG